MSSDTSFVSDLGDWFVAQSLACQGLGSPFYGELLSTIARRIPSEIAQLTGTDWRFGDMLPLRLMGAAHFAAQNGTAPALAAHFPSTGGNGQVGADLADAVVATWFEQPSLARQYLESTVQTNEVGRAAAIALACARLSTRFDRPLRLIEIGPSAGLNLRFDRYGYWQNGVPVAGDPSAGVRFDDVWGDPGFPHARASRHPHSWQILDRVGVDPNPLDIADQAIVDRLRSFVWPDQIARLDRLQAAITEAKQTPALLEATSNTAAWLSERLDGYRSDQPSDFATVIFHTIVWQYIENSERWAITDAIEQAAARATPERPLAWICMEPDPFNRSRAALIVREWPGGEARTVGYADYHGRWVQPLLPE